MTTLNVQYIVSLKEPVESTQVSIREIAPNSLIESAKFIEVIDIIPEELLERLQQGGV